MKDASSASEIVDRECVPGRVQRPDGRFKADLAAELLNAAEDISPAQPGPVACCEDKPIAGGISDVAHQALAKFGTEGNDACLVSLPVQPYQQVVEVNG